MSRSEALFARARQVMPGGVSSPVRAFGAVGGTPPFIEKAEGAYVWDVDGRAYVDYVGSWGPMILGHAPPGVVSTVQHAVALGTSYGAPCVPEVELAERICRSMPSIERVRFVSSGTEAVMSALRLARAFTGRSKILKFEGAYHGHADALLVSAGSGVATLGIPGSPGVPAAITADTLVAPYNDLDAVASIFAAHGSGLAAVIVEPVAGNMGCVPPAAGFLETLARVTRDTGALLIFDEVITGFRLGSGGAQETFGIRPDLTCLGKIIGGGLPVGAYGGRAEIMSRVAPDGPVYQAGTLSGNPLAMSAGCATLDALMRPGTYETLDRRAQDLAAGLIDSARALDIALVVNRMASMLTPFFTDGPVADFQSAKASDADRYSRFFHAMLELGIYLPPSQFETWFVSCAHGVDEIRITLEAASEAFGNMRSASL
jgi:glutamate-1-semialdehyde 2,1-aminomutase